MADGQQKTRPGKNGGFINVGGNHGGGRPKKLPPLKDLLGDVLGSEGGELEASEMRSIINKLTERAKKGDTAAAKLLFEYAYGKPSQNISVTGDGGGPVEARLSWEAKDI